MKKILIPFVVLVFAFVFAANVFAQDLPYLFEVKSEDVHAYWNSDGTLDVGYVWVFVNGAGSHPIDFVDVGVPNTTFYIENVKADVNGTPVTATWSDYTGDGTGFAVVMGAQTIPAGGTGTVHIFIPGIKGRLYPDWENEKYTSATFAPTWFGEEFVTGNTDFRMTFHLPPNVKPEEPRWHEAPKGFPAKPQTGLDDGGRVTYTWNASTRATDYYGFGASFPRAYVPAGTIYESTPEPAISGNNITVLLIFGGIGFFFIGSFIFNMITAKRRKMQYLPPRIVIEGHGIKRGLTAVEAAILMEQPLDKVLTMILFGVVKKNAAKVTRREPLTVEVVEPQPKDLYGYEKMFLEAFKQKEPKSRQNKLAFVIVNIVNNVTSKMRGFSRKETVDYYKSIMETAWQQVESANTPEVKSRKFDEELEWTMLDGNYDDRTRRVFHDPIFVPQWWGRYDPAYRPTQSPSAPNSTGEGVFPPTSAPASSGRASSHGLPGADFAAQMVIGVQTFSQKVVGDISTFTEKVTVATHPAPKPIPSDRNSRGGSSSGGGGSSSCVCACACACAGCACACAGGGR